jgi:arylsulfatase A-like enzyme
MGRRGFLARLGLGAAGAAACAGGANAKQLVSAIDYAPTFCHMLGIDDQEQMDGRNAWDLVTGKAGRLHDRVFTQFGNFAAVRNKKWHYFQHLSGPERGAGPCLYDLEADPGEKTNVIGQHAQVAAEMRGQIADRLQQKLPVVATEPG